MLSRERQRMVFGGQCSCTAKKISWLNNRTPHLAFITPQNIAPRTQHSAPILGFALPDSFASSPLTPPFRFYFASSVLHNPQVDFAQVLARERFADHSRLVADANEFRVVTADT